MKKIFLALTAILFALPMTAKKHLSPAQQLLERLTKLQSRGVMIGHQDDPMYGIAWSWERGRSDVKEVCGDYPAVMGFDLGKMELGSSENLDGVPFSRMREEIALQHQRGGISTLSWHPWNPATGEKAWDPSGQAVTKILPGGALNAKFCIWLNCVAAFIKSLQTPDGQRIPVIFRPWHEMTGDWFWWGSKSCTTEEYKQLYRYTHDYLLEKGCDNIVWAWSPGGGDQNEYLKHYPGNEYVDVLGVDTYQFDDNPDAYQATVRRDLQRMTEAAKQTGKLAAFTETGCQNVQDATWFTRVLLPMLKEQPLSYVLVWRNAWDQPKENYMPAPGRPTAADFVDFYNDPLTLFSKDIKGK